MGKITGYANLSGINLYSSELTPSHALGLRVGGANGSEFRYVKNGATLLVVGQCVQSPAFGTNWDALTLYAAAAIGATTIKVTNSANAVTADQFKWGTATIDAGTGVGQTFTILGHNADTASGTITLLVAEPVRVALAVADSKVTLRKNVCDGVVAVPYTTLTGVAVGVAVYPIPAATASIPTYGWVQTKGQCAVIADGSTFIMGSDVGVPPASAVTGGVGVNVAGSGKSNTVGKAMQAGSSGHYIPVELNL